MIQIPEEMIISDHFYIQFLRIAEIGGFELVDRHNADVVRVVRRNPNGTDGPSEEFKVR